MSGGVGTMASVHPRRLVRDRMAVDFADTSRVSSASTASDRDTVDRLLSAQTRVARLARLMFEVDAV